MSNQNSEFDETPKTIITGASLNDGRCNYSFRESHLLRDEDNLNAKGGSICHPDLKEAFQGLNVHLAIIDGVFDAAGFEIKTVESLKLLEETKNVIMDYVVTGFAVKGSSENESVILTGTKYNVKLGERLEIKTPKVLIDENGGRYKWYNELTDAVNLVRREVQLYREGKIEPVELDEKKAGANQIPMFEDSIKASKAAAKKLKKDLAASGLKVTAVMSDGEEVVLADGSGDAEFDENKLPD